MAENHIDNEDREEQRRGDGNRGGQDTVDVLVRRAGRGLSIVLISALIVALTVFSVVNTFKARYINPVDKNSHTPIEVEIQSGWSLTRIAETLQEAGVIRSSAVFKLYVDLSDNTSKLQKGKHVFEKSMTMQQIMDELLTSKAAVPEVTITIPEDWDIRRTAEYLANEKGFDFTVDEFIEAAKVENFTDYPFLFEIPEERLENDAVLSPLEGYLFPDTYRVYADAEPEDIMRKMLNRFEEIFNDTMMAAAEEAGMTMDEVVVLASVIQKEARIDDEFPKVSAVFHNRLDLNMALDSCATAQYLSDDPHWNLTEEEMYVDTPYNTYVYPGLPIGPICSPGSLALSAAIFPYESYMEEGQKYLYMVLKDLDTGAHAFNRTLSAHNRDKQKYEDLLAEQEE
jgi:UPF0755 protein